VEAIKETSQNLRANKDRADKMNDATESKTPAKVFITGASGFIGRALARRYRELGSEVGGVDFKADPEWGVVAGDLTKPGDWCDALRGVTTVIHCAAIVSNTATMDKAWAVNVKATADLITASVGAGVEHFVQLSSVAAFGFDFASSIGEEHPLRPNGNTYVDTKIASEHIVLASHAQGLIDCTIVRPGDVYGPGSQPWLVTPIEMMKAGKFLLPAHGKGIFSPVYIDDMIEGVVLTTTRKEGRGQIFTIGGGVEVSCNEFFGYHAEMAGCSAPRSMGLGPARALAEIVGSVTRLLGGQSELGKGTMDMLARRAGYSIEKACRLLGYQPQVDLDEGMRRSKEWAHKTGLI
jgi:nucleoside-diphosphate-sugar epimerase